MILTAFVDDSRDMGNDAGVFVLGGLVARDDHWQNKLIPDWLAVRRESPRINYFKTNHAIGAKKEFFGWDNDAIQRKMSQLASALDPRYCQGIAAHVTIAEHEEVFKASKVFPGVYGNPYYLCAFLLVERVALHFSWWNSQGRGETVTRIDFIFDKQGTVGPMFKAQFDHWLKPRYGILGECRHEDDRQFVPLQCADMYAAWVRRTASPHVRLWTAADTHLALIAKAVHQESTREFLQSLEQYSSEHADEIAEFVSKIEAERRVRRSFNKRRKDKKASVSKT